jgi:hypothetical protein
MGLLYLGLMGFFSCQLNPIDLYRFDAIPTQVDDSGQSAGSSSTVPVWRSIVEDGLNESEQGSGQDLAWINSNTLITIGSGSNGNSQFGWIRKYDLQTGQLTTVSLYQLESGAPTRLDSIVQSPNSGSIFAAGSGTQSGKKVSILLRSVDQGMTWNLIKSYQYSGSNDSVSTAIATDPTGGLYWLHSGSDGSSNFWIVLKSGDDGLNWASSDLYQLQGGEDARPTKIHVASTSQVIVVGQAIQNQSNFWITRRSVDGGSTWTTTDTFQLATGQDAVAADIKAASLSTNLFVVGSANDEDGQPHWVIRRSLDAGLTWTLWSDLSEKLGFSGRGTSIAMNSKDEVMTLGNWVDRDNIQHWLTWSLDGAGTVLGIQDQYQLQKGQSSVGSSILRLDDSLYFTIGTAANAYGTNRWVLRKNIP